MSEPENGFRAPLPEELAPLFPNYRILSLIATGGMGAVYHAMQTSLEREVAIKILPVEFSSDAEFCENFAAEAKTMARLNHPNLISVYDFGEVAGMLFIVMEYVPGQSLHAASGGSAVDPAEAIRLMIGISQGLAHAHGHGILHRDIKSANILLDSQLQPKIGDFGLARPLDAQVREGEAIYGTPGYTAPEVLEPPHAVDQRADIFSLGVLLHELLTGQMPESDPRPPSSISFCDPRLDEVVSKATHPSPQQRYQNAAEIADALQKIASSAGPRALRTATHAAHGPAAVHAYSRKPSKEGVGGLLVTVLLFAGMVAVYFFRDRIFQTADPSPEPVPVVAHEAEPAEPVPVTPEPVEPGPAPVTPEPETVKTEPEPVATEPESVQPEPVAVAPGPEPLETEPGPVVSEALASSGDSNPVPAPQPKFDVQGFLTRARAVMADRCGSEITRRDEALRMNLANFNRDAWSLMQENLSENHHQGGRRELDAYVESCGQRGFRMGDRLEKPLKFKPYLVELHKEHLEKEERIDGDMIRAMTSHGKTYIHGLGLKLKALEAEDDPVAVDMIKAEIDKTNASPDYFPSLMMEAKR